MKAKWRIKTDRAVDDAKTKEERQAEARLSTAEAELTAEAERQPATAEAERRAQAEQVSAAAQSVGQTDHHPGAVGGGGEAGAEEGAETGAGANMADEFAELFSQQRVVQKERHTGTGEDEGGEAANDDQDEKQEDEEEEGKGGKYGRPWMWAAAATIVVGLFLGPSLMPVLDGVKARFKPKETFIVQEEVWIVESDMANIREKASSNSRIIARVAYNSKVTGIKRKGSWVRVITDGAKKPVGWIHSSLLRPQNPRQ